MRIEEIHIDGFGHYRDRSFTGFHPGLTLICGANEAGKSTLLAFVRAILFGFPTRSSAHHYPPLYGGQHGGRVVVSLSNGSRYTVERSRGSRGGGALEVRDADGASVTADQFAALIGQASRQYFLETFTFDLNGLFGVGDHPRLAELLHGASLGAERIPEVEERLEKRLTEIFTPRQRTQGTVVGLLDQLEATDGELAAVAGQAAEYGRLLAEGERIETALQEAAREQDAHEARHREYDRQHRAWEDWLHRRDLDRTLADLEDTTGFPDSPIPRLEALEEDVRAADQTCRDADRDLDEARNAASIQVPDEALLEAAEDIEALRRDGGAAAGWLRDLPLRRRDLETKEEELARLLEELGPGWTEERVASFDISIPRRAEISASNAELDGLRAAVRERARELDGLEQSVHDATEAVQSANRLHNALSDAPSDDAIQERAEVLRRLRRARATFVSAGQRVADLVALGAGEGGASETRGSARALPGALVLGGGLLGAAAGAGLAWILGASLAAVGGVTAGFMLMAAVLWALSRRHPSRSRHPLDGLLAEARHALATAEAVLRDEARGLGDGPRALPDLRTIEAAEAALERERPRAEEQRRAEEQLATARAALARVSERREGALTRLEDAQAALGAAEQGWRDWLQHAGLPLHLAPSTADALLGRIEVTRSHLQGVRELRRRVGDIAAEIARYRARVEPLARRAGAEVSFADEDTVTVADALIRRYDAAREARRHREQALALVDERERTWASARSRMSDAQDALAALLAAGGVKDPETFRRRARVAEQREAAEQERRECERRLRQLVGDDDDALKALDDALASTTREEIAARRDSAQTAIEELRARRDELITRRGSIAAELARLQGDEHASEVRARAAALRSQLDDAAQRWSALALARTFLQRTRERYERDRQPAVIRRAEAHFEALTGGRYVRLYQPVGEPVVRVEERDGGVKTPGQLSRGSREQLYLALRLGAIEEAVERNEPLPVIVDDVMVNFDRTRARRAAEAFVRLAAHTQVVVFTCHAWVAELFAEATSDVAVIDLDHVDFETGPTGTIALPAGDGDESRARRAPNEGGASTGDGDAQITQRLL